MVWRRTQPSVSTDASSELSRQHTKKTDHWNCPLLTQDPGFGQMPPGMLWIRTDMVGCERYRFYDENGNVVTLCGDDGDDGGDVGTGPQVLWALMQDTGVDEVINTTTETYFTSTYTFAANSLAIGDVLRLRIGGSYDCHASFGGGPGTLEIKIKLDSAAGLVDLVYVPTFTMAASQVNSAWIFQGDFGVVDLGEATLSMITTGVWSIGNGNAITTPNILWPWEPSSPEFAETLAQTLKVSVIFGTLQADNRIDLMHATLEKLIGP